LEGIGWYQKAIFQCFLTFGKNETVADKGSCFGWAKYQASNFCTAESILGFQRPLKHGLKHGPKSTKNGSGPASQSRETPIYTQIVHSAGPKKVPKIEVQNEPKNGEMHAQNLIWGGHQPKRKTEKQTKNDRNRPKPAN